MSQPQAPLANSANSATASRALPPGHVAGQPLTALAPMQDVTDLAFMRLVSRYGAPDYFFTEYFRVHAHSTPEARILRSINEHGSGRPVFAQIIGESLPDIGRTVRELLRHPVAGIDLNMGCPAPKVYKKNVGGGLLRDLPKVDQILGAMRAQIPGLFTVKTRLGFDTTEPFEPLLELLEKHAVDLLSLHARTVKEMYRSEPRYAFHARAARRLRAPVLANGNITSAAKAARVLRETGTAGVMVGRSAIRNPGIFAQIRSSLAGQPAPPATLGMVRDYIERLHEATRQPDLPDRLHVAKLKKYLNFIGQSVDPEGAFVYEARRAESSSELFRVCDFHLLREPGAPFAEEPYPGVVARPNHECAL